MRFYFIMRYMKTAAARAWEKTGTEGVWIAEAADSGPTVGVLGGVHGDEPGGIEVVNHLLNNLVIERGTVIAMLGNMAAIAARKRYTDANLNRSFVPTNIAAPPSSPQANESRRAQELMPYLDQCNALLDLHEFKDPRVQPFIICERNARATALRIGAPVISFGWSTTEPGGSDGYMYNQGKEGLCYELGSFKTRRRNVSVGIGAVRRFMAAQGLTDEHLPPLFDNPLFVQADITFRRTSENYQLARAFNTFERLVPGEPIATLDGVQIRARENQLIIFPETNPRLGDEAFTLGTIVPA